MTAVDNSELRVRDPMLNNQLPGVHSADCTLQTTENNQCVTSGDLDVTAVMGHDQQL